MLSYQFVPYIIGSFFAVIVGSIYLLISRTKTHKEKITAEFLEKLQKSLVDENVLEKESVSLSVKWNNYWGNKFKQSELVDKTTPNEKVGSGILLTILTIYGINCLIFRNFGIGIVPAGMFFGIVNIVTNSRIDKKEQIFLDQIPNFLSLLKSNIQSGETAESALINAIENIDDPLYSELKSAKAMASTGTFSVAIRHLRKETSNDVLRFLCGCIEMSISVGANLEEQIEVIEEILERKMSLRRKIQIAIAENKPLIYITMFLIPVIFIYSYISNDIVRAFWFQNLLSWVIFFVCILIFVTGLFISEKIVKNTSNF